MEPIGQRFVEDSSNLVDGLHPSSDGLQPTSFLLLVVMASNLLAMACNLIAMASYPSIEKIRSTNMYSGLVVSGF